MEMDQHTPADDSTKRRKKIRSAVQSSRDRLSIDVADDVLSPTSNQRRRKRKPVNDEDGEVEKTRRSLQKRVPRSVSEEVLALEGKFRTESFNQDYTYEENKSRRSKIHRRERSDTDPAQTNRSTGGSRRQQSGLKDRKKKKTRSAMFSEDENYQGDEEISEIFHIDKEDMLAPSSETLGSSKLHMSTSHITGPPALPSQHTDILFIEKKDGQGFIKEHKSRVNRSQNQGTDFSLHLIDDANMDTALNLVLRVHIALRSFAMIGQGLLAGIAISQCVFVYALAAESNYILLEYYQPLALTYQAIFYLMLAISVVSVLDRFVNLSFGWSQFFLHLLTRPLRALGIVAYFLALIFSVSLAQLDDKISLYNKLTHLWDGDTDELSTWKVINLLRVIGSVFGWILIAIPPVDDLTESTIEAVIQKENDLESKNKIEMKSSTLQTWDGV